MSSLFSYGDIKNTPRRSGFDLSNKCAFTAKVGELLPTYWKFCLPGDKFHISQEWFARTQPVDTSAFTRIREYYEWFFVPLHLLYRNSRQINPWQIAVKTNRSRARSSIVRLILH